jgi:ATP synthase protein I
MVEPPKTERPDDDAEDRSVTDNLASRIREAQAARPVPQPRDVTDGGNTLSRAYRMASEFVAAIVVGGALGFGVDWLFKTQPWGLVIFILLGFAAGVLNVVRAAAEMNKATAVPPGTPALKDDEDE